MLPNYFYRKVKNLWYIGFRYFICIISLIYRCSSAFFKTDLENVKPYPTVPSLEFLCATGWKTQALMVKSDLRHVTVIRNYALSLFCTTNEKCHFTSKLSLCFTVCLFFYKLPSCPGLWKSHIYTLWVIYIHKWHASSQLRERCGKIPQTKLSVITDMKSHLWSAWWLIGIYMYW